MHLINSRAASTDKDWSSFYFIRAHRKLCIQNNSVFMTKTQITLNKTLMDNKV